MPAPKIPLDTVAGGAPSSVNNKNNKDSSRDLHPFGGCNRLLGHYQTIGAALLDLEDSQRRYGGGAAALTAFREGVSFVPVEVLESYLDDLLTLAVREETLFIQREFDSAQLLSAGLPIAGLLVAIAGGLYASSQGASAMLSFALTVSLALPFAVLWHYVPRGATRRVRFAQVLSQEIARRRGHDGPRDQLRTHSFGLSELFGAKASPSAPNASFDIYH